MRKYLISAIDAKIVGILALNKTQEYILSTGTCK